MGLSVWVYIKSRSFATFLELTGFDQYFRIWLFMLSISHELSVFLSLKQKIILSTNQMLNGINHVVDITRLRKCFRKKNVLLVSVVNRFVSFSFYDFLSNCGGRVTGGSFN
jgi:hypothetical protein